MAVQEITELFDQILEQSRSLDPANARKWFEKLTVSHFAGGLMQITCPDEATADFLRDNCTSSFTRAAQQVTGHLVTVSFNVAKNKTPDNRKLRTIKPVKIHPDYTFDNFVVGPANRLAHASCVAVSNSPGDTYNPLFLYGSVGLGKTHLLHAVCAEAQRNHNHRNILFLSCEELVNRFINAIEQGRLSDFQNQYRKVDMLVIDDVQFLRDHEQSQEEFFHTFNALYNNRKQIVLSADSPPGEIASLEERLISRFKWGLVARIDSPTYETRVAIVQKKAHLRGLELSEDVAEYIANKVRTNIRELEGSLTTLYAEAMARNEKISLDLAKSVLGDRSANIGKQISISDIIDVVTRAFDIRLTDLQSKKRSQSIAMPRQICMYLARSLTRHSLEEIGGHLGGRDHTTVMHACSKISELENSDPRTKEQLALLQSQIMKS
ncbi:MAG: chromosomal replication initiator protein DnaA [Planctomycetota bacterium]